MVIDISQEDFGILCICAVRYCQGRESYMPDLVRRIVRQHLGVIDDDRLWVMLEDCEFQKSMNLYGDERIDRPGWIRWREILEEELERRKADDS